MGISANMLGRWVQEFNRGGGHAFLGHGKMTPEEQKGLRRLREEYRRLKIDNDILRKARNFFAKRTQWSTCLLLNSQLVYDNRGNGILLYIGQTKSMRRM